MKKQITSKPMLMTVPIPKMEYEKDFYAWAQHQSIALKKHDTKIIDFEHLAEEIKDLGNNLLRELESRLTNLMMHLLKMEFQPEYRSKSWVKTISEQRRQIKKLIEKNPSLKSKINKIFDECYSDAVEDASLETGKLISDFPSVCPWSQEEILMTLFKEFRV